MENLSVSEFKTRIAAYLRRVEKGEAFIITDHKRPVAEVMGIRKKEQLVRAANESFSLPDSPVIEAKTGLASQLLNEERGSA